MNPIQLRQSALEAERRGDTAGAAALFDAAITAAPRDAAMFNSAGSFHARGGNHDRALALFDRALTIDPGHAEAAMNRAIALGSLGRAAEAFDYLGDLESALGNTARYWSLRGNAARQLGRPHAAIDAYERCLALDPMHVRARRARARLALECGQDDVVGRFDRALADAPADPQLLLGKAQALDATGDAESAVALASELIVRFPGWTDPLELLAQLRWQGGDTAAFCDHYASASHAAPGDAAVTLSWARMLAGAQRATEAADIMARAAEASTAPDQLRFAEAVYAGEGGDAERADALFARLPIATADERTQWARHQIRRGRSDTAAQALEAVVRATPRHIAGWALLGIAWRVIADPRCEWLHGQPGLVRALPVEIDEGEFAAVIDVLRGIHAMSARPIGQSVRAGTQTRGALFDRLEPELARLSRALHRAVDAYRRGLPEDDPNHPLLAWRKVPWRISKSWSVRFSDTGRHASHIHPQGIVSSAMHLVVPASPSGAGDAGQLELGRPPADLGLDLPPTATVTPRPGHLVLFPSTLYHGTRPFDAGERLSVAFDVNPA